jgi:mRNA interferase RelE/StbE
MSSSKPGRRYRLEFLESALREWRALDGSVKEIFKKHLASRLAAPHSPGSELHGALAGCYKIKLRAQGYRLVYQVRDKVLVVLVIAIDRRDKDKVYRAALKRVQDLVKDAVEPSGSKRRKLR